MMMPVHVGQRFGNYRLMQLLSKGGSGEVYLGEDVTTKKAVAVKILLSQLNGKETQRFFSEAQTLRQLIHPNIIQVHACSIENGVPFIATDSPAGKTLRQRYPKGSLLPLEQTVILIKQVAGALQYAHDQDVVHRDVKPDNIWVNAEQQILVDNFDMSLLSSPIDQDMAGTLPYMAPEQWRGKTVLASDQYSLGIMAYEWLCGVRPFEGAALRQLHTFAPVPSLREKAPSLPEKVETVLQKALSKDPRDRHESVLLFALALERAAGLRVEASLRVKVSLQLGVSLRVGTGPQLGVKPTPTASERYQEKVTEFIRLEKRTQDVVKMVQNMLMPSAFPNQLERRLLTVIEPSESKQLHVVINGLFARLQGGALPASKHWIYLDPITPRQHPLDALASVLRARLPSKSMKELRARLNAKDMQGLHQLVTPLVRGRENKVVLLIDQFEALFSRQIAEGERRQFIDVLWKAVTEPMGPLIVLLTLRADFYRYPLAYPALGRLIQQQQCTIL